MRGYVGLFVTDDGPLELVAGEFLLFQIMIRQGMEETGGLAEPFTPRSRARWTEVLPFELTDPRYGVLGVSPKRLIEIESIISLRIQHSETRRVCS